MRIAEIVCALAVLGWAGLLLRESTYLEIGWEAAGPGAGFFPFWLATGLALSAAVLLVQVLRAPAARPSPAFVAAGALRPILKVFVPMVGVVVVMEVAGFYVAAALYLVLSARLLGRHGWLLALGAGVLFPLVTWFVFERWFLIPLPKGYLGGYLPF